MKDAYHQIIDANINRVTEGLRVIEDHTRFVARNKKLTDTLATLRKEVSKSTNIVHHLSIRDTTQDMRAFEPPPTRKDIADLLKANFKRVEEGLRVLEEYTGNPMFNRARYVVYELEKEIVLTAFKKTIKPGVYLISDDPKILEQGLIWGVSCIQLRDKVSLKAVILKKARLLQKKAKKAGIPFIVNDYLDIAILSDADGLHVGQDDLDIALIRKLFGPHKIIGKSTHSLAQGLKAQKEGADYVGIGPIFATPIKSDQSAIGFDYLREAKHKLTIPYVAIGDINLTTMPQIAKLRPPLVAVVRAYQEIPAMLKKYKQELFI